MSQRKRAAMRRAGKKISIDVDVKIYDATDAFSAFLSKGVLRGMRKAGIEWERDIKKSMKKGKVLKETELVDHGAGHLILGKARRYGKKKVSKRNLTGDLIRETSNPGEPPGVQTGALRASIGSEARILGHKGQAEGAVLLRVGTENIKYAKWLEQGTSKMEARPFLGPKSAVYRDWINNHKLRDDLFRLWTSVLTKIKLKRGRKV